ncbi:GAP family protein [Gordonia sp. NPDC003424]
MAILDVLPAAIGLLLVSAPVALVSLTVVIKRPFAVAAAFLAGWLVGLLVASAVILLVADGIYLADRDGPWLDYLKIVVGLLLVVLAVRKWRGHSDGDDAAPKWLSAIDTMTSGRAATIGFLLAAVNPKNVAVVAAAAATIADATHRIPEQVLAVVVFAAVGTLAIAAPVLISGLLGDRAAGFFDVADRWTGRYGDSVVAVVLAVLGVILIVNGVTGL